MASSQVLRLDDFYQSEEQIKVIRYKYQGKDITEQWTVPVWYRQDIVTRLMNQGYILPEPSFWASLDVMGMFIVCFMGVITLVTAVYYGRDLIRVLWG